MSHVTSRKIRGAESELQRCRPAATRPGCGVLGLAIIVGHLVPQATSSAGTELPSTWPQAYTVHQDDAAGRLILRTPYYEFEHDLRRGGAISRIRLTHGRATNLLVRPLAAFVREADGRVLSDLQDAQPKLTQRHTGLDEEVTVETELADDLGHAAGLRLRTTFHYRWGYVKIHREFLAPAGGLRVQEVCPATVTLAPSLSHYGYREGKGEEEGAPPFSFGSNRWGKLRPGQAADPPLVTRYIPRSMMFVDPGVEGLEWFVSSDLAQWDLQLSDRRGHGLCRLEPSQDLPGLALVVAPFARTNEVATLRSCAFDFYVAVPLLEGHALRPWLHTSFNRNRGNWVTAEQIQRWAKDGMQTVHCHNDGDYYGDGLFWRDGAYPPYPDMDRYDAVLNECHQAGIRTATYFSNKELHPSTPEFQQQGPEWARLDLKGRLQHNFFRGQSEFGAQLCLRSGWLDYLKLSIDRVLKHHPLDGVYYDWNVALFCYNPRHEGADHHAPPTARTTKVATSDGLEKAETPVPSARPAHGVGHWDIDELLDLMEWTRQRVGPRGLVIVHNTTTPMFATENFADDVVATEWGYQKWTDRSPDLENLPLEWSLAGARNRGVISYGTIPAQAPRRLHQQFALEALLGGVTPWPASPEIFHLLPLLQPLGDFTAYQFLDWRNRALVLSDPRAGAAAYSRPGVAFFLVANLEPAARKVTCRLDPKKLPYPLGEPRAARQWRMASGAEAASQHASVTVLDASALIAEGLKIRLPGDGAILLQVTDGSP